MQLIVVEDFPGYTKGEAITDEAKIEEIRKSEFAQRVVASNIPAEEIPTLNYSVKATDAAH